MQMQEARNLRAKWGGKACNHSELEKEYDLGTATGDYVCTKCGESGMGSDWNEQKANPKQNDGAI